MSKEQKYTLFVFHLPRNLPRDELFKLFRKHDAIGADMMNGRGFGFVHFASKHRAELAIKHKNGHRLGKKRLKVSFRSESGKTAQKEKSKERLKDIYWRKKAAKEMAKRDKKDKMDQSRIEKKIKKERKKKEKKDGKDKSAVITKSLEKMNL